MVGYQRHWSYMAPLLHYLPVFQKSESISSGLQSIPQTTTGRGHAALPGGATKLTFCRGKVGSRFESRVGGTGLRFESRGEAGGPKI